MEKPILYYWAPCSTCSVAVNLADELGIELDKRDVEQEAPYQELLALGGELGCTAGPGLVGFISNRFNDNMKIGFFAGTIFPIVLLIAIYMCKKIKRND